MFRRMGKKKCKICGNLFDRTMFPANRLTCSMECHIENCKRINAKHLAQRVERKCTICSTLYWKRPTHPDKGLCKFCTYKKMSKERMGKKNPAYRNGKSVTGLRKYTGIHLRACSKYRKAFLEKHGYLFCEICSINSMGTQKFEVHHIYYASLYPKHKELHNFKNLILICIKCHNDLHSGKMRSEVFLKLEKDRGLKELFKITTYEAS